MSKVMPADVADGAMAWAAPDMSAASSVSQPGKPGRRPAVSAASLQTLQEQAYQEAYEKGLAEGLAEGREQVLENLRTFESLVNQLVAPFQDLDQRVERELVELAFSVTRQLIRRELKQDPSIIVSVVRDALDELPASLNEVRIRLSPSDATLLGSKFPEAEAGRSWVMVEDASLQPGDCLLESRSTRVDARVESRIAALMAVALGEEPGPSFPSPGPRDL